MLRLSTFACVTLLLFAWGSVDVEAAPALTVAKNQVLEGLHGDLDTAREQLYLVGADRRLILLSNRGEIKAEKKYKRGCIHDLTWVPTPKGAPLQVLVSYADAIDCVELPSLKVLRTYEPTEKAGGAVFSAVAKSPNGPWVFAENSTGCVVTLDTQNNITDSFQTQPYKKGNHHNFRIMRPLSNGNFLVCHSGPNIVREYSPKGDVIWEHKTKQLAFKAIRLENGNTMVASLDKIQEFSPDHKIVWAFHKNDVKDANIRNMTGFEILPNGNILVGCYSPHSRESAGESFFEITRDKKLVWGFSNRKIGSAMSALKVPNETSFSLEDKNSSQKNNNSKQRKKQ